MHIASLYINLSHKPKLSGMRFTGSSRKHVLRLQVLYVCREEHDVQMVSQLNCTEHSATVIKLLLRSKYK